MAPNIKKSVLAYASVAFILLGVLFGMNIMTFIFGSIGPDAAGFTEGSQAYNVSSNIQNDSLASIETYSSASTTQFSIVNIAIILVILISLFLLFWTYFMGGKGSKDGGSFA